LKILKTFSFEICPEFLLVSAIKDLLAWSGVDYKDGHWLTHIMTLWHMTFWMHLCHFMIGALQMYCDLLNWTERSQVTSGLCSSFD